jgi:Flp pilus assembly protein TadD
MRTSSLWRIAAAAAFAAGLIVLGCSRPAPALQPPPATFLNQAPSVRYVGVQACRKCHVEKASTFAHTGMGRAFYRFTSAVAVEDFSKRNELVDPRTGVHYRMTRRGPSFFMKQFVVDPGGRERHADEREMTYVLGSGNHARSYVTVEDGRLWEMPVCWYPDGALWDLCPGFDRHLGNFGRKISDSCVFCHNGRMVRDGEDDTNRFLEPIPEGIDCERCHGPGELHVEKWSQGAEAPTGNLDPTIVNPARLPSDRRIQVCFQCHMGDSVATERANRAGHPREDFRPGQSILDAFVPVGYVDPTRHDFGLSAQGERLLLSACYRKSGGKIECLTCHDPHVTVFRKDRPADFFRAKCLGCHAEAACKAPASARGATSPPDDCVRCHMRRAWADDQRHADFTDHWIRKTIADDASDRRASQNVIPLVPADFRKLAPGEQAYEIARGMFGLSTDHPPGPEKAALLSAAEAALGKAIASRFDRAEAYLILGKVQNGLDRPEDAARSFREAVGRDPKDPEATYQLAKALDAAGARDEAIPLLESAVLTWKRHAGMLAELGSLRLTTGHPAEALIVLEQAARLQPFDGRYEANRAAALQALGRKSEALAAVEEAVRRDPDNPEIWRTYGTIHEAAGDAAGNAEAGRRIADLRERARLYADDGGPTMAVE